MTAPRPPDHLDDEALSALLDGNRSPDPHLASCAACSSRFDALGLARDALREAVVAPLPRSVIDDLVAGALTARPSAAGGASVAGEPRADVVPLSGGRRRGRRLRTPPPVWVLSAVAALAVVVGLAGLLRAGGGGTDMAAETNDDAGPAMLEADGRAAITGGAVAADALGADPEVVVRDLGDVADAGSLAAALATPIDDLTSGAAQVPRAADESGSGGGASPSPVASGTPAPEAPAAAAGEAGPPDRARCRPAAERIGAGRFGVLLATATLRWAGQPAEVLVFSLQEPAGGLTRQALVLARPGCALLADPRW